jgi:hypothetical protein
MRPSTRSVIAGVSASALAALAVLASLVVPPVRVALADGGTLRVANVVMGAYRINVYTDPTPIPPDTIDVSVLATFERGRGVAIGLEIEILAHRLGSAADTTRHQATREQADDPRFYAAKFKLGSLGPWEITTRVSGPEGAGEVSFQVDVQEPGPLSNPFLILGLALIPLALVGWWLKSSSSPSTRPEG